MVRVRPCRSPSAEHRTEARRTSRETAQRYPTTAKLRRRKIIECRRGAEKMVLRERIELSTSPLPRECSTTELPQHSIVAGGHRTGARRAARYVPQEVRRCKPPGRRKPLRPKSGPFPPCTGGKLRRARALGPAADAPSREGGGEKDARRRPSPRPDRAAATHTGFTPRRFRGIIAPMTESSPPRRTAAEEKADRLAQALRANLRRRKDQARGRDAAEDAAAPPPRGPHAKD